MLSRSFHNAMHEVKNLGISTDSAIQKHSEWMNNKEIELIRRMEEKTMKKAVQKTVGMGNNARFVNIKSYEYPKNIKIRNISRAVKASDCKVFKLYKDDSIDNKRCITIETFTIRKDGTAHFKVENEYVEWEIETTIENAREKYAKSLKQGYTKTEPKVAEAVEKTEVEPKKQTAKKSEKKDSKKTAKKETAKKAKKTKKANKVGSKATAKKSNGYKEITKGCKTVAERYQRVIDNAKDMKELERIKGWLEKDKRLTEEERNDLGWDLEATMWHMGQSSKACNSKASKAKKPAKKTAPKKETAKKETAKKVEKVEKAEKASNSKVFILKKGNKMYRFTVTKNRGILVKGDGYRYVRTEEARWIYKRLLKEGYKRVA